MGWQSVLTSKHAVLRNTVFRFVNCAFLLRFLSLPVFLQNDHHFSWWSLMGKFWSPFKDWSVDFSADELDAQKSGEHRLGDLKHPFKSEFKRTIFNWEAISDPEYKEKTHIKFRLAMNKSFKSKQKPSVCSAARKDYVYFRRVNSQYKQLGGCFFSSFF